MTNSRPALETPETTAAAERKTKKSPQVVTRRAVHAIVAIRVDRDDQHANKIVGEYSGIDLVTRAGTTYCDIEGTTAGIKGGALIRDEVAIAIDKLLVGPRRIELNCEVCNNWVKGVPG